MLSAITALLGTIVGFVLKTAYDYYIYSKERYDRYFFALLSKRFEVYQDANYQCERMKKVLHDKTEEKYKVTGDYRVWYHKNNLYFSPDLRENLRKLLLDVDFYGENLADFYITRGERGKDNPETQKKREELYSTWANIMVGIQDKLQKDINYYFNILKS